uniref:Major sperm protein n=1 Tax=Panagrolaimus davidi TaxID=227884 RepID=A0A914PXZ1_9BILA
MASGGTASGGRKLNENKPDEPPFQMKIVDNENSVLTFRAPPGGFPQTSNPGDQRGAVTLDLKIKNTTKHRQTYKVKCTSFEIFRVRPPVGFIKPGETLTLKVSFLATTKILPENNKHFFAIYHFKTNENTPAPQLWTSTVKPEGRHLIDNRSFENPDGTLLLHAGNTSSTATQGKGLNIVTFDNLLRTMTEKVNSEFGVKIVETVYPESSQVFQASNIRDNCYPRHGELNSLIVPLSGYFLPTSLNRHFTIGFFSTLGERKCFYLDSLLGEASDSFIRIKSGLQNTLLGNKKFPGHYYSINDNPDNLYFTMVSRTESKKLVNEQGRDGKDTACAVYAF